MDDVEYRLLRRTWFPVARIEDVAEGVVAASILGSELVVYRARGTTTVAAGHCPHRGAALGMGSVVDDGLQCPYHGWRFEPGTGRCVHVPSLASGLPPAGVALWTYPVREAYGHVWTCLEDPYLPFPELLDFTPDEWHLAYGIPQEVSCGMRQLTENFRDVSHFPFVHADSMGPHVKRVVEPYTVRCRRWQLEWTLSLDLGGTALGGSTALATRQSLVYRLSLPMCAYAYVSFPAGGRRLVAQFATPVTADGLRVRQFWVVGIDETVAHDHGTSLAEMWEYERRIFEEDHPIVENQWPKEAPLDSRSQAHTSADRFSIAYRREYVKLLASFAAFGGAPTAPEEGGS